MNYFELFGLEPAPSVDKKLIPAKYIELQRKNHPDFFTQDNEAAQEEALGQSASINKAFGIFQNDDKTLEYFLRLEGLIEDNEKYNLPPEFLMEMMEINEGLAEDPEAAHTQAAAFENTLAAVVNPLIENYQASQKKQSDLLKLKDYYYKKKYLNRILDRLGD